MDVESLQITLDEMRHSFDTAYSSARKYTTKTFTVFGAELTLLLFYLSGDELKILKGLFENIQTGWFLFAIFAFLSFLVAAVLFVLTLATDKKWSFPPDDNIILSRKQYQEYKTKEILIEFISEYDKDIKACVKKVHKMKVLSDTGTYFLIAGTFSLLIIKLFGV